MTSIIPSVDHLVQDIWDGILRRARPREREEYRRPKNVREAIATIRAIVDARVVAGERDPIELKRAAITALRRKAEQEGAAD